MKQVLYSALLLSAVTIAGCKKNLSDYNQNPKEPELVPAATLFSNAEINLADVMASTNVNTNNFRLFAQYWTETTYMDETNYDLNGRQIPDRWYDEFYRDVIKDLDEAGKLLEGEKALNSEAVFKNKKAILEILTVYSYYTLLTTFGNIPYGDALNIGNVQPTYDDASEVFGKIAVKLDDAIASIDPAADNFGSADIILDGDTHGWQLFANSLKMRMGLLIADQDAAKAKTMVEAAAPNVISSSAEDLAIHFLAAPPNTNPVWEDLIQSGRIDFVAAGTIIDKMKALNDPRIPFFFQKDGNGDYTGQPYGTGGLNFSLPATSISDPTNPHKFFSYADMEFLKAEAVERGMNVGGGTAAEHYNNAVTASIEEWGGSSAEATAYLAQPSVAYATAAATWQEKIGIQSWLGLYNRGYDAWTQWRRLDFPVLAPGPEALSDVPVRMTYPVQEQNLNKKNYNAASAAIGSDIVTQKLWFDKH